MDTHEYPSIWPQFIPSLEAALQRHEQASVKMADFKKKYTSAKSKVKRIEKYMVSMDEVTLERYEHWIAKYVRLAENKFILIDKKVKKFNVHEERYCKASLKALKVPKTVEPNMIIWHIQRVAGYLNSVNHLLYTVGDMLRIANGHLANVDHVKKQIVLARKRGWLK